PDAMSAARFRLGIVLWSAGSAYNNQAWLAESCRWLDSSAVLVDQMEVPREAIKGLYMASYVKRMRGKGRECLLDCERVVQLAGRCGGPEGAAAAMIAIGEIHLLTREYGLAVEDFRTAYRRALQGPPPGHVTAALAGLGLAQLGNGETAAAEATFRAVQQRPNTASGSAAVDLDIVIGTFFLRQGQLAEAESHLQTAHTLPPEVP